ncbi:DUF421 domain-containing protein [Nonlabens spongiae]|uniref:DUF421 domain-containing protein n=2 Tax=Nonlabens spongiae TaxID=331648 RepID=A0A1W6MNZ4_9FLAO|nr:DUF421 domain-containing protein [Nonlabens spongiae]
MPDWNTSAIIITSVLGIFIGLIIIVRIAGLRTFAKMTSFDFATTIAIGSILASVSISPKNSIGNGIVALITIIAFQLLFALIQRYSKVFKKTATNEPVILMRNGEILEANLAKCNLDRSELIAKLREANVLKFSQVQAAVFESTGDVSVLHTSGEEDIELEERLLDFLDS